ncbi:hypothetical protein H0H93_005959 [Arthromyces matolae]|nr:hypothetical protein H0H93_005959 [Arthromyces matolae]
MDGVGNRPGWAWIFILEGLFTVLFGISSYFTLPHSPERARFLTEEEREYVVSRLRETGATGSDDNADGFSWKEIWQAFTLPQVGLVAVAFFFDGTLIYALAYFTPSIIASLGYTNANAQLYSVPPFAMAFVVAIVVSYLSDRFGARGLVTIFAGILSTIGSAMFYGTNSNHVRYGSLFMSITGAYTAAPALSTWNANNTAPYTRRATAIAIGFIMTNSGGILATWLLGTLSPAPLYRKATLVLLIFSVLMTILAALNIVYLKSQNRKKEERRARMEKGSEEPGLGDRSAWELTGDNVGWSFEGNGDTTSSQGYQPVPSQTQVRKVDSSFGREKGSLEGFVNQYHRVFNRKLHAESRTQSPKNPTTNNLNKARLISPRKIRVVPAAFDVAAATLGAVEEAVTDVDPEPDTDTDAEEIVGTVEVECALPLTVVVVFTTITVVPLAL